MHEFGHFSFNPLFGGSYNSNIYRKLYQIQPLWFQSFVWWKLQFKSFDLDSSDNDILSFNPLFGGSYNSNRYIRWIERWKCGSFNPLFGGSYNSNQRQYRRYDGGYGFQSFVWWKLQFKWLSARNIFQHRFVSILCLVEVTIQIHSHFYILEL